MGRPGAQTILHDHCIPVYVPQKPVLEYDL